MPSSWKHLFVAVSINAEVDRQFAWMLLLILRMLLVVFGFLLTFQLLWGNLVAAIGLAVAMVGIIAAFAPAERGYLGPTSFILACLMITIVAVVATVGYGIHDVSLIALPAILIGFGLLLRRAGQIVLGSLSLGVVIWLSFGALAGLYTPLPVQLGNPADFAIVAVILLITTAAVTLLTERLHRSLAQAQQEITERMRVEAELQAGEVRYRMIAEQAQQRAEQLAVLNTVGRAVSTVRDLPSVLELIYQQARQSLPIDAFFVGLYDSEADQVYFPIIYDGGKRWDEPAAPISENNFFTDILANPEPILINRTPEEIAILGDPRDMVGDTARRSASIIVAPLIVSDRIIGIMSAQSYTLNAYTRDDVVLLTGIGYQAAIAIENARLYAALQAELAERQALIKQLEAQNAELERFTYTVSHDLKSPLVTIGGFLGFIRQDVQSGNMERFQRDVDHIAGAVQKMHRLLNELLELSRIGRLTNPPERISFATIVYEALELSYGVLQARDVQVILRDPLPDVLVDRVRLVEVVQNLLDNAVRFMGDQPAPQITIGAEYVGGEWVFSVQDNGIGIAPRFHQKIFGLFEQLDKRHEGTGIGLALVKRIIEVHNGRIWVESEIGEGATFKFTLPTIEQNIQ